MGQEAELMLTSAMQDMRQKYIYFILTATGACLGFTVTQTRDAHISMEMVPLGLAVICWAFSFFCGCRSLYWKPAALASNIEILKIRAGMSPLTGSHPEMARLGVEVFTGNFNTASTKFSIYMRVQFGLFMVASVLFLAWHVLEMWSRQSPLPG